VLSRQAAGIMSSDRRPERTDVLLWRVLVDNGPDGSRPKDQRPNPTIPPSPHGQRRIALLMMSLTDLHVATPEAMTSTWPRRAE
jgi:hypothetical protein